MSEYSLVTGPVVCRTVLMSENSLVTGPVVWDCVNERELFSYWTFSV